MEIIRISAIWCSSCIIMKQRVNDVIKDTNFIIKDYDYDMDTDIVSEYQVDDVLPVLIYEGKILKGEHSKEEIKEFLRID